MKRINIHFIFIFALSILALIFAIDYIDGGIDDTNNPIDFIPYLESPSYD